MKSKLQLPQHAMVNFFFTDFFSYPHNGLRRKGRTACSLSTRWFSFVHCLQVEWEFGMFVFVEGGKLDDSEKNLWSKDHRKQQA